MNEYIALFFTHSGAIKFERFVKSKDIQSILMPVPRKLSSSCGVGVRFEFNNNLDEILIDEVESIYEIKENNYKRIYISE